MDLQHSKSSAIKNILIRIVSFVIYFFVSGLAGKLISIFVYPVFSFVIRNNDELLDIVLYITGVVVTLALLSFFSLRDGYTDTELLTFSYLRAVLAYVFAAVIVCLMCIAAGAYYIGTGENILEYFLFPYFPPHTAVYFVSDFITSVVNINYYMYISENVLCLSLLIIFGTVLIIIAYGLGRLKWINKKKKKIEQGY